MPLPAVRSLQSFANVTIPDSKFRGANMGPIWGRQDPGGPRVGPMNFFIRDGTDVVSCAKQYSNHPYIILGRGSRISNGFKFWTSPWVPIIRTLSAIAFFWQLLQPNAALQLKPRFRHNSNTRNLNKMADMLQKIFWDECSWMKMFKSWFNLQ